MISQSSNHDGLVLAWVMWYVWTTIWGINGIVTGDSTLVVNWFITSIFFLGFMMWHARQQKPTEEQPDEFLTI